jgi:UDP-N-acetylmuramyl pentapeptide phosphotransferase/UDP-N-acetylglucosamine-1-phosphate transferase
MPYDLIIAAVCALAVSLALNRAMLALAPKLGLMDQPGERRIHSAPVPRAGGIAIWLGFLLVVAGGLASGLLKTGGDLSWNWLGAFAAGSLVLMLAGVLDDRGGLQPLVKLGAHALAPTVFFLIHPIHTGLFPEAWGPACDMVAFIIWSVVLINAFNLIDGLDGLCGGLAAVATLGLAAMALVNGRVDSALLLLVMGGAILGFLKYNLSPARIFLGDAGSMLMGFFLATAATEAVGRKAVVGIILLPIAVAGVPLLDVLLAIWRRGARRLVHQMRGEGGSKGIFEADRDHLHHRLLESRGSQHNVAVVLHGVAIVLSVLAFLPMLLGDRVIGLSLVGILIVGMVGVRHLARVEMEQMGSVVHLAIKLPNHRRRVAALLFVYDLGVLAVAAMAAALLETNRFTRGEAVMQDLLVFTVVFTSMGSIATLMAGVHARLWVRATLRDLVSLLCWLLLAAFSTFTLFSLANASMEWSALRLTLMSYVIAAFGVSLPRVVLDMFREFGLEARHRQTPPGKSGGHGPVVVLGAGDLGTLLLDHLKSSAHDQYPGMRILGFLDETRVLHGRRLRSFRILGGLSMVPNLVEKQGLRGIVLAINRPRRALVEHLEQLAATHGLRIYRWKVGINPLAEEPVAVWNVRETVTSPQSVPELVAKEV